MRRTIASFAALAAFLPLGSQAQTAPPHAFLFGSWTGGLFPPLSRESAVACLASPSVIFTRDDVLIATLTSVQYAQREIESVRGIGDGVAFRFTGGGPNALGCTDPDGLEVIRVSANQIKIPNCANVPFPLVRCPAG